MSIVRSPDLQDIINWAEQQGFRVVTKDDGRRVIFRHQKCPRCDVVTDAGKIRQVDFQSLRKLRRRLSHIVEGRVAS